MKRGAAPLPGHKRSLLPYGAIGAALAAGAFACADAIPNPTGSCEAPDSGARAGAHAPGGSTWLPDCAAPLRREYWRVFATSAGSAYTIPRLDGSRGFQAACADARHELKPLLERYQLCAPALSAEQVALLNSMPPKDALTLTRFLHTTLRFVAEGSGVGIEPAPFPTDVLDACELRKAEGSAALTAACERERERLRSGTDVAISYRDAAAELAPRLNELYGIR